MDQFISALGAAGHATLLDCRSLEHRHVPIPPHVRLVICNSMVRHELTAGEYNERRMDCEDAARYLDVPSLREANFLKKLAPAFRTACAPGAATS